MSRALAIDYGGKRCGLAVTDPERIIATGLQTVATNDLLQFLSAYFQQEPVDVLVVGLPKRLDNSDSEIEEQVVRFIKKLKRRFPDLQVERMDERFTSSLAVDAMVRGGLKKMARRNKSMIDKVSAVIILQSWMELQAAKERNSA